MQIELTANEVVWMQGLDAHPFQYWMWEILEIEGYDSIRPTMNSSRQNVPITGVWQRERWD